MLISRPFWQAMIEQAWKTRNIIWLMGVRRVGKTSLCQSLQNVTYFDCERPRIRYLFENPESFLESQRGKRIILDEIHRLDNPSEILKLAADYYQSVKIIATGSSTLGVSAKFKDTLTGRKKEIWLTPLLLHELSDFGNTDIKHRLLFGGLPPFFASKQLPEDHFKEWIDSYWAKDIQEIFRVEKRYSFQKFTELLLAYSGGQFEASKFAAPCEVSRQTISNYLAILETTFVIHVIRPYTTHKPTEIVMAPKVYSFDTGFTSYAKGWQQLRKEDIGLLWEQCVLNEMHAYLQNNSIHYWRSKRGHEIDFVVPSRQNNVLAAIECKYSIATRNVEKTIPTLCKNIKAFRNHYPKGKNYIVAYDVDIPFKRSYDGIHIFFVNPTELISQLKQY